MWSVTNIIVILIIGFIVYSFVRDYIFPAEVGVQIEKETFKESPAFASPVVRPAPEAPPQNVMPSGPNPPSQQGPPGEVVQYGEPVPHDNYMEDHKSAHAIDQMRSPESSYRPAPGNYETSIAEDAGIASSKLQVSAEAIQPYGSEFTQNGGEFLEGGVYANDTSSNLQFTTF